MKLDDVSKIVIESLPVLSSAFAIVLASAAGSLAWLLYPWYQEFADPNPRATAALTIGTIALAVAVASRYLYGIAIHLLSRQPACVRSTHPAGIAQGKAPHCASLMAEVPLGENALEVHSHFFRSLQPWLTLLHMHRQSGREAEFEVLALRLREEFNLQLIPWKIGESGSKDESQFLEDFPHIIAGLTRLWGRRECLDYLYELLEDNGNGNRVGFPLPVFEEIFLLAGVLEAWQLNPPLSVQVGDPLLSPSAMGAARSVVPA